MSSHNFVEGAIVKVKSVIFDCRRHCESEEYQLWLHGYCCRVM